MLVDKQYSITLIQDEVRALLDRGTLTHQNRLLSLSEYYSDREWQHIERVLTCNDYILRDRICDLVSQETWDND